MSLGTVIIDKNREYILMAADSRASLKIDGKRCASGEVEKIKNINGYLVFGCGKVHFINQVFDLFEKSKGNMFDLGKIINSLPQDTDDEIVNSFLAGTCENGILNIYSLTQSGNYEVELFVHNGYEVGCMTSGMKSGEAIQYLDEYLSNNSCNDIDSLIELLTNMYKNLSDEAIGGHLSIYKIDKDNMQMIKHIEINDRKDLHAANDVTVNFARGGNATKSMEPFVPYLNAGVQGLDKFFRGFKNPKTAVSTLVKGGIAITAPEVALYMINKDDPAYQELDNRTKDTYFLIPKGDGTFIKIPKSRELGVLFGSLFQRVMRAKEGDKESFKGFGNTIKTSFAPASPFENSIFTPIAINLPKNKDFANRSIVPQGMIMDKRSPYLQYDERTTEIAKAIGQLSHDVTGGGGLSPKQIDYLIKSYTGVVGQLGIPLATEGGNVLKAITTQFTSDPLYSSQTLTNFYDNYDKLQTDATDKNIVDELPTNGKENIVTDEEKLRNEFKKASAEISSINKEIKQIETTFDPFKETKIRELRQKIQNIAKAANAI